MRPEYCIRIALDPSTYHATAEGSNHAKRTDDVYDEGWAYFCGQMSREDAEALLHGFPEGAFLIRKSDLSGNYRIVVKESRYQFKHIEFKWRDSHQAYRCGRESLRGQQFPSLMALLTALEVNLQLGIVPEVISSYIRI
jgi:hypothetical protein